MPWGKTVNMTRCVFVQNKAHSFEYYVRISSQSTDWLDSVVWEISILCCESKFQINYNTMKAKNPLNDVKHYCY